MKVYLLKDAGHDFSSYINLCGVDNYCVNLLNNKTKLPIFFIKDISTAQANILKQEALSVGGDAAIHRDVITGKLQNSDMMLMCNYSQLLKLNDKLKNQPFSLGKIIKQMIDILNTENIWNINNKNIFENNDFIIMGVLNLTPDSFYDGGKYDKQDRIIDRVETMLQEGAHIIDIGGESTRPFSEAISIEEEKQRVMPVLKILKKRFKDIIISIDTYKSDIAKMAIDEGADIINDISGFNFDKNMINTIKNTNVSSVIMHIKGTPKDMQLNPQYKNLMIEIAEYLRASLNKAEECGIDIKTIAIDPGIGFGKTVDHNYKIIKDLMVLKTLQRPVLIGTSNKSFIGKFLNLDINERIEGTIACNIISYLNGSRIFRVHNVKENIRALKIAQKVMSC